MSANAKHQAAVDATAEQVAVLRAEISTELRALRRLNAALEDLAGTRQSIGLGFLTPDDRKILDEQVARDRALAHGYGPKVGDGSDPDELGKRWLNASAITSIAATPAPTGIAATSAAAELVFAVRHHVARLARVVVPAAQADVAHHRTANTTAASWGRLLLAEPPTTDGDFAKTARHLERLVAHYDDRPGLQGLLRDLERLEETARDVVDGPARTNHPEPCPWCGRNTLVVHHRTPGRDAQLVRCEGRHPCECDYEWCDCHRNPIRNRHEWVNSSRATNDWRQLRNLQNTRKELTMLETRALDALEQIQALHQPTWTDAGGREWAQYVTVLGANLADVAPDHECITEGLDACQGRTDDVDSEHSIPACTECQTSTLDGDPTHEIWPCRTYQLTQLEQEG